MEVLHGNSMLGIIILYKLSRFYLSMCMGESRRGQGVQTSTPGKSQVAIGFLRNSSTNTPRGSSLVEFSGSAHGVCVHACVRASVCVSRRIMCV